VCRPRTSARADGDHDAHAAPRPAQQHARRLRQRNADEGLGRGFVQALLECAPSMPGSISTGTAPALNSANISRNSSGEGRTISTVRVPRTMPMRIRSLR
jgi:hypothetical protein